MALLQSQEIGFHFSASKLLHMPRNSFLDALPDLTVPIPGEIESIQQLTKLSVIHQIETLK